MTIETKYSLGDEVWFVIGYEQKPIKGVVICVNAYVKDLTNEPVIEYSIESFFPRKKVGVRNLRVFIREEEALHPTHEELLKSL